MAKLRIGKYEKGPMGFMADMREAMGRLKVVAGEWCAAYYVGDTAALESLGLILGEATNDLAAAARGVGKSTGQDSAR